MEIHLAALKTTQSWVRSINQVKKMLAHVQNAGIFTIDNIKQFHPEDSTFPLIRVSQFPDGSHYLHDGHHRAVSIWLGGRDILLPGEYEIQYFPSIAKYAEVNPGAGWYTPINLDSEVRLPDTRVYKRLIQEVEPEHIPILVKDLKSMYATPRIYDNVVELAEAIAKHTGLPLRQNC